MPKDWVTAGCRKTPNTSASNAATDAAIPASRTGSTGLPRRRYRKKDSTVKASSAPPAQTMLGCTFRPAAAATPAASSTWVRSQGRNGSPRSCRV